MYSSVTNECNYLYSFIVVVTAMKEELIYTPAGLCECGRRRKRVCAICWVSLFPVDRREEVKQGVAGYQCENTSLRHASILMHP